MELLRSSWPGIALSIQIHVDKELFHQSNFHLSKYFYNNPTSILSKKFSHQSSFYFKSRARDMCKIMVVSIIYKPKIRFIQDSYARTLNELLAVCDLSYL